MISRWYLSSSILPLNSQPNSHTFKSGDFRLLVSTAIAMTSNRHYRQLEKFQSRKSPRHSIRRKRHNGGTIARRPLAASRPTKNTRPLLSVRSIRPAWRKRSLMSVRWLRDSSVSSQNYTIHLLTDLLTRVMTDPQWQAWWCARRVRRRCETCTCKRRRPSCPRRGSRRASASRELAPMTSFPGRPCATWPVVPVWRWRRKTARPYRRLGGRETTATRGPEPAALKSSISRNNLLNYHRGQEVLWSGVFVGSFVCLFITLDVTSRKVQVRFLLNLAKMINMWASFTVNFSEVKVKTTVLKDLPLVIAWPWFKISSPTLAIGQK